MDTIEDYAAYREQRFAQRQQQDDLKARLWKPVVIKPIATLITLRDAVLSINAERCPKWKFRLAPDLVVQLQPFPGQYQRRTCLFRGLVVEGEGITKEHFGTWKEQRGFTALAFNIFVHAKPLATFISVDTEQWEFRGSRAHINEETVALKARIIAELPQITSLHDRLMFSPNCLCCGKGLTDPVSMARWIGPECAHNHSLLVGLFNLI